MQDHDAVLGRLEQSTATQLGLTDHQLAAGLDLFCPGLPPGLPLLLLR
jgi:hypothetical protein